MSLSIVNGKWLKFLFMPNTIVSIMNEKGKSFSFMPNTNVSGMNENFEAKEDCSFDGLFRGIQAAIQLVETSFISQIKAQLLT